jgi:septal ring factor EnvC (AmiA/AmiB activator)
MDMVIVQMEEELSQSEQRVATLTQRSVAAEDSLDRARQQCVSLQSQLAQSEAELETARNQLLDEQANWQIVRNCSFLNLHFPSAPADMTILMIYVTV